MAKGIDFINDTEQYFHKEEIMVKAVNGKDYKIIITPKIKDTDLSKLVSKLMENAQYCNEHNHREYNLVIDMYAQILRLTSDIKFQSYKDAWKQITYDIKLIEALIDLQVFNQILERLDKDSIKKLQDSFENYKNSFKTINNQILSQQLKDDENGEV